MPSGALLKHRGEWVPTSSINEGKVYRGPNDLAVIVSLDPHNESLGTLLHVSLSYPAGYPTWDVIYAVARAFFGTEVDCMMPIPREEAFLHGAVERQRRGKVRQVFHLIEMPVEWPSER